MATTDATGQQQEIEHLTDRLTWLEPHEIDRLLIALAAERAARGQGFTEAEAVALIEWAQRVRVESALLSLALKGAVRLDWDAASGDSGSVVCASTITLGEADAGADAQTLTR